MLFQLCAYQVEQLAESQALLFKAAKQGAGALVESFGLGFQAGYFTTCQGMPGAGYDFSRLAAELAMTGDARVQFPGEHFQHARVASQQGQAPTGLRYRTPRASERAG
ncbi:hypothetical protein J7302_15205 [Pseudomonas sp. DB1]|uniref:Uncharacterized protein n=1 Tax=Metapseudomonas boanensis TaxID=2822138 RepID=A0ABS5XMI9_9GAMM|nr:hypothetical protein [Pseudomonas boanensis]MBT8767462.1 hypothetical protein [Pseudomonas boanensis]